jgi:hypothetical protein
MSITNLLTSNVMFALSIIMIVCAIVWLFGIYIISILKFVSPRTLEIILYFIFLTCIYYTPIWFSNNTTHIWGLLFVGGLNAEIVIKFIIEGSISFQTLYLACMFIYSITGIYLNSTFICGVSIIYFILLFEYECMFGHKWISNGYSKNGIIISTTIVTGLITLIGIVLRMYKQYNILNLFVHGMLLIGSFIFFVDMLIISSTFYTNKNNYITYNIITIGLSVLIIFVGITCDISQIYGYSGTIFIMYVLRKYYELIPRRVETYAWTILITGIILYTCNITLHIENREYNKYFHIIPFITS